MPYIICIILALTVAVLALPAFPLAVIATYALMGMGLVLALPLIYYGTLMLVCTPVGWVTILALLASYHSYL